MAETIEVTIDDKKLLALIAGTAGKGPTRVVADGVEYGIFNEMGTTRMAARPCAGPAAEDVRPGFQKAFKGAYTRVLAEAVVEKAARDVERRWKEHIVIKNVVDTGAYLNSIHVVRG